MYINFKPTSPFYTLSICIFFFFVKILTTSTVVGQEVLVPAGSVWKYLDDGSDQGTSWREIGFDDHSWSEGHAQLGYGDGDEATHVSYGPNPSNKYVTTYFRHSFEVSESSQYVGLMLRLLRDDGAVVYLNGVEIVRSNMHAGTVRYYTLAASAVAGDNEDTFYKSFIDPGYLIDGMNVLAVEIHQVSVSSTDISFDLEFTTTTQLPGLTRKAPYLIYTGKSTEMQILWQLNSTASCTLEWGTDTLYSIGSEQTSEYRDDHQHTYTITDLTPSMKYYYRVITETEIHKASFMTAPDVNAREMKFIAYGDSRSYPSSHDQIAAAIVATYSDDENFQSLIISTGDIVYDGDYEDDWDNQFFDPSYSHVQTILSSIPYQACMGNHEGSGELFKKYFPYPFVGDRYWSFDYGIAHFVVIDQYTSYRPGSPQLTWIENDLASTTQPCIFFILHEPGWSSGGGHENNVSVQNYIQPLCEKYQVLIVFAGHNHYYARAEVNGVQHVTTGGGGAPLHDPDPGCQNVVTATKEHHFCKVEIEGDLLTLTAVTPDGKVIDTFVTELSNTMISVEEASHVDISPNCTLHKNYPNPFNRTTTISISLKEPNYIELKLFNVKGKKIRTLIKGKFEAGDHYFIWNGKNDVGQNVSSGLYINRLQAGDKIQSKKMLLIN